MNIIQNITRKELLSEAAGISFIVRRWAKILKQEVEEQSTAHKEAELKKIKDKPKPQEPKRGGSLGLNPEQEKYNDPFYWEDESSKGKGSHGSPRSSDFDEEDWWKYSYSKKGEGGTYYQKNYGEGDKGKPKSRFNIFGGYGGYEYQPYIPPLKEVIVLGEKYPEEYAEFSVDKWVMKDSGRIEYDHWHSGYDADGKYVVILNIPISFLSETAFVHEIKHAYDDWNRMRHGAKPIRDSWEIKNIYTKDFEKLILGTNASLPQLGNIIRNFYLGSKLEAPAYLENEYDDAMIDYEDVGKKLKNFNIDNFFNKQGEPVRGLEEEFKKLQTYDIPLFKKFKNVTDFLVWVKKYFNHRGEDIFRKVVKMRYVHNRPEKLKWSQTYLPQTQKPQTYTRPIPKTETPDFEEGEGYGNWKYSREKGWYYNK